jgi:hypothetical protein
MAPRVGLEPTTLRLQGFPLLPKGSDYLITLPELVQTRVSGAGGAYRLRILIP